MADERAVFIGGGVFKVDRERALEKLMCFALPDPAHAALLLVRCAVASEAAAVRVQRAPDASLTISFDGTPLSAAELSQPYDSLFQKASEKTRRGRELATALLTLLRLKPARILVRSGLGNERAQLRVTLAEQEIAEPMPDGRLDTVVKFVPGPRTSRALWGRAFADTLRASCGMAPMPVFLDDERLPHTLPAEWGDESSPIQGGDLHGSVAIPPRLEAHSRLQFYRLGVLVGETTLSLATPPVVGRVDDPAFRLNVSQTAVVRDDRYKHALAAIESAAWQLIAESAKLQRFRTEQLTLLLDDIPLRQTWSRGLSDWLETPAGMLGTLGRLLSEDMRVDLELGRAVRADARRTAWLREAAARAAHAASDDRAEKALSTPIYLSPDLQFRTHNEMLRTAGALGYVPVTSDCRPENRSSFPVVLLGGAVERASLIRLFPGLVVEDAAAALERTRRLSEVQSENAAILERLGVEQVLCRRPLSAPWRGEIGLTLHRPDAAHLHAFIKGGPDQAFPVADELRLTAIVDAPFSLPPERIRACTQAVLEAAPSLYAAAAAEFSPEDLAPANEALRAHLLDALAWEVGRGAPDKLPTWLRTAPLFPSEAGLLDYQGLRTRFSWGDTLFFLRRRSRLPVPALTFRHESFTLEFLKRLLPDAQTAAVPGRPELRLAWLKRDGGPAGPPKTDTEGLARLEDILRRRGALPEAPADPDRAFVLETVSRFFTPWIGAPRPTPRWHRVREHLAVLPFLRRPKGVGLSPLQLDARLASGRPLLYGSEGGPAGDVQANAAELALLKMLWPSAGRTVAPAPAASPRKSRAVSPRRASDAPAAARPIFEEPMLVVRELELEGVRAAVGLPVEPLLGVTVSILGQPEPLELPLPILGLAAAGRIRIDVSAWSGPIAKGGALHPRLFKNVTALYQRFLDAVLDDWPRLSGDPSADGLRTYFLLFAAPRKDPEGTWNSLRERLDALALFPTLNGGSVSLGELRIQAKANGRVRYAKAPMPPPTPADAEVPVVRQARLAAAAVDAPFVPCDSPTVAATPPSGDSLLDALENLLSAFRGRRGLASSVLPEPGTLRLFDGDGHKFMARAGEQWNLDRTHPAARLVIESFKTAPARAPFLLSLLASEANRDSVRATDAHDALFQLLLAEIIDQGRAP